jgi:hypothetical protein
VADHESPDFADLLKNYTSAAAPVLLRLIAAAKEHMSLDEKQEGELALLLIEAWKSGAETAQAEMVAQAIEQGAEQHQRHVHPDS